MGYTTYFDGEISIEPPLDAEEVAYLQKFSDTRRMDRKKGPYFVGGTGMFGQGNDPDILDSNRPPKGQPGLWCKWTVSDDGRAITWNGAEKFYASAEWMKYIIDHFLKPDCHASKFNGMAFIKANHTCNGVIEAQGEESSDRWDIVVENNVVYTRQYSFTPGSRCLVE